jgi:hypothetical protein
VSEGLSVILPVRWDSDLLKHWFELYDRYSDLDNELIIIADQPTWQTLKLLQEKRLKYYLVENSNLYENWNYGSTLATKDYICFMQEDYHFSPRWDYNILRRMTKNAWGGAFKLGVSDSDPMRHAGSHFCKEDGDIASFDFTAWENYCAKRSLDKTAPGHPLIYTFCHETFDRVYGFGISPFSEPNGHIHHEAATWMRFAIIGGIRWEAYDVFCLHYKFGCAYDLKNHAILDLPLVPDWGRKFQPWPDIKVNGHSNNWCGTIRCRDCQAICDPVYDFGGWPACQQNLERQQIVLRGYWLCPKCREKNSK